MTRDEIVNGLEDYTVGRLKKERVYITVEELQKYIDEIKALGQNPTTKNDLVVDYISRADALRVAKNEYLRGWHNALCKALSEKYSIHCEEGNFSVIQEETITGLGLSIDCALGKDVESYMSTMPSVTPQQPVFDKIRAEIEQNAYPIVHGVNNHELGMTLYGILQIFDKYKSESEE